LYGQWLALPAAFEQIHAYVGARNVEHLGVVGFLQRKRMGAVGDQRVLQAHRDARAGGVIVIG
jgi:hypothetical protein